MSTITIDERSALVLIDLQNGILALYPRPTSRHRQRRIPRHRAAHPIAANHC